MIELNQVVKKYGKLKALDNVSLHCPGSECIALIGPNACGKTTLIKSILGMVIPDSGEIRVKEQSIAGMVEYRNLIGYMPQTGSYPVHMTIGQVIHMITQLRGSNKKRDEELIGQFRLREMFDKRMGTLSGGTTQKVSAALAFLFHPEILILDEPTAGLDPIASEILREKITDARKSGKLVLVTSHVLSELDDLVTQIIYMQDGKILFRKNIHEFQHETGEEKISKGIAKFLKSRGE